MVGIQIPTVVHYSDPHCIQSLAGTKFNPIVPNRSNVAEPMLETVKSIQSRQIERISIELWTIDQRSTLAKISCLKQFKEIQT